MTERWHGTPGGYTNHRCRCDKCRSAWALYQRGYRRRVLTGTGGHVAPYNGDSKSGPGGATNTVTRGLTPERRG